MPVKCDVPGNAYFSGMIGFRFNWRLLFALLGIGIVCATIFYSQFLARKIEAEEKQKIEQWQAASATIANLHPDPTLLSSMIIAEQRSIPAIATDEKDSIVGFVNLDSVKAKNDKNYLADQLKTFRSQNPPLETKLYDTSTNVNRYYYGHTVLLDQVRYYPLIQIALVAILVFFIVYSINVSNRSTQNQVWAGLAKETAHQLGTPVSSLQGWVEMLRADGTSPETVAELQKDVDRLQLISDRFSKIGSRPVLEPANLVQQLRQMVDYMRKRTTSKVTFIFEPAMDKIEVAMSKPLFDWVLENLLKNAIDAMEGMGTIRVEVRQEHGQALIDISDTGKGIAASHLRRVFDPGFTTKKRGWGLGLTLSKRIIEEYHGGSLAVQHSEPGKGTTFRILLKS